MLLDGTIQPQTERLEAARDAWAQLVGPGPTLIAAERIGVIHAARAAWASNTDTNGLSLVNQVAHRMAFDAVGMNEAVVAGFEAAGLSRFTYLEIVGIVARLANIDIYATGLGATCPPTPTSPDPAPPTGELAQGVAVTDGYVPATGNLFALSVLDALPDEGMAFKALHEPFYVPFNEFLSATYSDDLTRAQIEYVAAKSSSLNECFY
jgi:hypothetical protein